MRKIIGWILVALILSFAAALIFSLTNGFTSDIKSFAVMRGENYILNDTSGILLVEEETFTIKHYSGDSDISAKIYPMNLSEDYRFEVDGHEYSWNKDVIPRVKDFSDYVDITVNQKDNTVKIVGKPSTFLQRYAEKGANGKTTKLLDTLPDEDMFRLEITSGGATITLKCRLAAQATGIVFSDSGIYF